MLCIEDTDTPEIKRTPSNEFEFNEDELEKEMERELEKKIQNTKAEKAIDTSKIVVRVKFPDGEQKFRLGIVCTLKKNLLNNLG